MTLTFVLVLETVQTAVETVNTAANLAMDLDKHFSEKLEKQHEAVAERPESLINAESLSSIAEKLKPGSEINFQEMSGFDGIKEYRPPGWKIQVSNSVEEKQPDAENQKVRVNTRFF